MCICLTPSVPGIGSGCTHDKDKAVTDRQTGKQIYRHMHILDYLSSEFFHTSIGPYLL